jgi:cob(I)alamin adenosyltransferase
MSPVIYTRTGDSGETSLASGARISKDDPRVEAYGTVDELSSVLGVVSALLEKQSRLERPDFTPPVELVEFIEWIQDKLFVLSGMLAMGDMPEGNGPTLESGDILFLERHIDAMETALPALRNFILPGGSEVVSFIHLARTVCRRAERHCTGLKRHAGLNPLILSFLNRLSDDLFVFARWVGFQNGETEKIWLGRKRPEGKMARFTTREAGGKT